MRQRPSRVREKKKEKEKREILAIDLDGKFRLIKEPERIPLVYSRDHSYLATGIWLASPGQGEGQPVPRWVREDWSDTTG